MEESYLDWLKEDEKEFLRRDATNCALLYRIQLFGLCHPCLANYLLQNKQTNKPQSQNQKTHPKPQRFTVLYMHYFVSPSQQLRSIDMQVDR